MNFQIENVKHNTITVSYFRDSNQLIANRLEIPFGTSPITYGDIKDIQFEDDEKLLDISSSFKKWCMYSQIHNDYIFTFLLRNQKGKDPLMELERKLTELCYGDSRESIDLTFSIMTKIYENL